MKESAAARQILDLVARHHSELDSEAISWVYSAAYKVFRAEARVAAERQLGLRHE